MAPHGRLRPPSRRPRQTWLRSRPRLRNQIHRPRRLLPPLRPHPDLPARLPNEHLTDRLYLEAEDFIRANSSQPFFLYLAHYAPHTRMEGKPDLLARFQNKPGAGKDRNNPQLAAMLASIDQGIGRLTQLLADLKLDHNTLFVFTSDNGGEGRVTSNAPLRGAKSELFEGGIRVPFLARCPAFIPPNSVCSSPISAIDYYPTLLQLAGLTPPPNHPIDGRSFLPLLRKPSSSLPNRPLFWHYPLDKPHFLGGRSAGAIRDAQWKLIEFFDDRSVHLYDLARDPGESNNLAASQPNRAKALQSKLAQWRTSLRLHV